MERKGKKKQASRLIQRNHTLTLAVMAMSALVATPSMAATTKPVKVFILSAINTYTGATTLRFGENDAGLTEQQRDLITISGKQVRLDQLGYVTLKTGTLILLR